MPSASPAEASIVIFDFQGKIAPLAGAVISVLGAGFVAVTVTVRAVLVVWAPRLSVARAVIEYVPTGTLVQSYV
jgi:hypothetical protein